jgi:probable addiction module antidote protein
MSNNLIPFEITAYLDSEEAIAEYLSQVQADGDPDELLRAISHVAKAKGIAETLRAPPSDITRPTE